MSFEGQLVWLGYQKTNSPRILGAIIWVENNRESFAIMFFFASIFLVNTSIVVQILNDRLKACEFFSCVKFITISI